MTWALPLAGLLALGVAGPLIAHLLSRRPPAPRPFPTLQFLTTTPTSARRLRTLHDPVLWALRTLIVLVVAGAAAGPTLVTASRQAAWQAPVLRAVVTAPGREAPEGEGRPGRAGDTHWMYTGRPVRAGIAAAVDDMEPHTDVPREIVVRWDGSRRTLHPTDIESIPSTIGVRLDVVAASDVNPAIVAGVLEIVAAPGDAAARAYVLEAVPWTASRDALLSWPGAVARDDIEQRAMAPSADVREWFRRMRLDPRLADAAQRSHPDPRAGTSRDDRLPRDRFEPLARSAAGDVLLWGAMIETRAVLVLDSQVGDPLAVWSVRVAADAQRGIDGWPQPETSWSEADLRSLERAPAPVAPTPLPGGLDTRWWWLAALVLVLVEGGIRQRMARPGGQRTHNDEARDAA